MSHDNLYSEVSKELERLSDQYGYNTPSRNDEPKDPALELIKKLVKLYEAANKENRDKRFRQASFDVLCKGTELAKILLDVSVVKKPITDQVIKDFSTAVESVTELLNNPTNMKNAEHVISQVRELHEKTSAKYQGKRIPKNFAVFLAFTGAVFTLLGICCIGFCAVMSLTTGPLTLYGGLYLGAMLIGMGAYGFMLARNEGPSSLQLNTYHNITSMYKSLIDVCSVATETEHAAYLQKHMPRDDQDATASIEPASTAPTTSTFSGSFFNRGEHTGTLSSPDVRGCPETKESTQKL